MESIPVAIPPNNDVASSPTPPATMTTPKGRAMRWLLGSVFSAKMMTAAVSIQARFITPSATKPTISPAQQPRQSTPHSTPSSRPPVLHQEEQWAAAAGVADTLERRELVDATGHEEQSR